MRRGNGDAEKVGPMFPRLHVNDTAEKGGPRAPPRNKMALYEQFSVPFQRFNPNSNSLPQTRSSSLGNDPERSYIFPVCLSSQTESYISHQSNVANMDALSALEHRKKVDGDDSRAYDRKRIGQSNDKTMKSFNGETLTPTGSGNFGCLVSGNVGDKDQTQFGSLLVKMRKDVRNKGEAHLQESLSTQKTVMPVERLSTGEIIDSPVRQAEKISDKEDQRDACLQQESNYVEHGGSLVDSAMDMDNRNSLVLRGCFRSTVDQTSVLEAANHTEYHDTNIDSPIDNGTSEGSDDVSKNSTLENMPSPKLSPDGVVEILGQQHFWKARRKITKLVDSIENAECTVQHLIAESSNLLLDAAAILGKSPLQGSNSKSLSLEEVVEPQAQNHKQQDHSENQNHKWDCSAENGVEKTSFSSQKYGSHLSNYTSFPGNSDKTNVGAQCFNQSPGHQWLIPVMSPSEGLVYKPYPGPGFPGAVYGPPDGTFMNPAYGVPNFHQAIAMSPFIPPSSYAYFPPPGMPAMNQSVSGSVAEQVNQFVAQGSRERNSNSPLVGADFDTHNQSSRNFSNQNSGAISHVTKSRPSRERELACSPNEEAQGIRIEKSSEGRDARPSSFTVPLVSDEVFQSVETRQKPQVIRVVPHNNPRSATVSAARIFQSIQEERKQYDLL
ncbi:hypothetical protein RYX36_022608 [Vicia faba]